MDSINNNQPEDNHEDLSGMDAVKKIKELTDHAGTCFFCTGITANESFSSRPMSVQEVDDQGNLWFLSASDSKKNAELAGDSAVQLLFQGSQSSDFLSLYGQVEITTDKAGLMNYGNQF